MAAITLQNIEKSFAGQTVLDGVSLNIYKGEKVGLIGANGSGKTTLFKLIVGLETPDVGTLTTTRGIRVAYLPQEPDLDEDACLIEVVSEPLETHRRLEAELQSLSHKISDAHGCPEEASLLERYDRLHRDFEVRGGYGYEVRIREVLGGLGFTPEEYKQPVKVLSGGQKCRASLARLLMSDADLLLLDEPTNHLDIDATRWLERYLATHPGGAVVISHDRYLLDRVVTKIIEIEDHNTTVYPTNYTHYAEAKRIKQLQAVREYQKQSAWIAHQKDYINRARYRKDTAKQARSRQKLLENMASRGEILESSKRGDAGMKLRFDSPGKGGDMVIRCERACKGFGEIQLIRDLDFEMNVGEKIGIIGPNGVGKTTLLRMLLGQEPVDSGRVRLYENLSVGYYDQEHRDLDPSLTVIEAVRAVRPDIAEGEARSYLALFLFRGDDVFKRIGTLSGGEQSRILLAKLVWSNPQVLVLDEPTNHLDIPAREALENALQLFGGSIVMVSHDRYFLDRIATRLLVLVARTRHEVVNGNWSAYAELLNQREKEARVAGELRKQESRRQRDAARRTSTGKKKTRSKYARKRIEEMENAIMSMEARIEEIESLFGDPAVMKDLPRKQELHEEYDRLRKDLAEMNQQWEEAVDAQSD